MYPLLYIKLYIPKHNTLHWDQNSNFTPQQLQEQPQQNRNLQRGAARFSAPPPFVGAATRGRRTYFAVAAVGAAAFFNTLMYSMLFSLTYSLMCYLT